MIKICLDQRCHCLTHKYFCHNDRHRLDKWPAMTRHQLVDSVARWEIYLQLEWPDKETAEFHLRSRRLALAAFDKQQILELA